MVSLGDRCRQTSVSKASPFVLLPPEPTWFALSSLPSTADIPLVLVGRTAAGAPVADAIIVGRGHLDEDGAVVVDVVESGAGVFDGADVIEIFASATMSALLEVIAGVAAAQVSALAATLGDAATRNVGSTAGTVAAGDDARFAAPATVGGVRDPSGPLSVPGSWVPLTGSIAMAAAAGDCQILPFVPQQDIVLTEVSVEVAVAGAAGAVIEFVVYNAARDANGALQPTTRLASLGTVAADSLGRKVVSGLSQSLTRGGLYCLGVACSVALSYRSNVYTGPDLRAGRSATGTSPFRSINALILPASFPTPPTAPTVVVDSANANTPRIYFPVLADWTVSP